MVHLKSCLSDMLLMPLIRLEKWRRTTSSTACKCQSGWEAVQLENNIGVGKVKGEKIPSGNCSPTRKNCFKKCKIMIVFGNAEGSSSEIPNYV